MGGEAVGTIIARPSDIFSSTTEVSKYLYCDGSKFSASDYPKLFTVLGTTTLPDLRERFLEGLDTAGTYLDAGLPNITGIFNNGAKCGGVSGPGIMTGAFYSTFSNNKHVSAFCEGTNVNYNFDASRCSNIYKDDCTTVQPPAYTVRYYIRAK